MTTFICLLRPSGGPIADVESTPYRPGPRSDLPRALVTVRTDGLFALVDGRTVRHATPIAHTGSLTALGNVRLDNRTEVRRILGRCLSHDATDLLLALRLIERRGIDAIRSLVGDFAFVVWDAAARELLAARDPFGRKPLYYTIAQDLVVFSSRARALATREEYDLDHVADYLVCGAPRTDRTIFSGVRALPAASLLTMRDGRMTLTRWWSPWELEPDGAIPGTHLADALRALLSEAIAAQMGGSGSTWVELSGGLDASAIVGLAQSLARSGSIPAGLAGAVMIADSLADSDAQHNASLVARHWHVRQEMLRDHWLWQDDHRPPPPTDAPSPLFPFYARDRRLSDVVQRHGGRILLTSVGPDAYLTGSPSFLADWIARGRLIAALRELARWAALGTIPFWRLALEHALLPLAPRWLGSMIDRRGRLLPPWVSPRFAAHWELAGRIPHRAATSAPAGRAYPTEIATALAALCTAPAPGLVHEQLDVRSPFLYRPLVELGVRIPPELRTHPLGGKWVLREAVRGLIPENVRLRTDTPSLQRRIVWSLVRERHLIDRMLQAPILAELGCIIPDALARAVGRAREGDLETAARVLIPLSLETWLRARAGWWETDSGRP
jgi:asparagine synthase (glutamine-hydrolysing)